MFFFFKLSYIKLKLSHDTQSAQHWVKIWHLISSPHNITGAELCEIFRPEML